MQRSPTQSSDEPESVSHESHSSIYPILIIAAFIAIVYGGLWLIGL